MRFVWWWKRQESITHTNVRVGVVTRNGIACLLTISLYLYLSERKNSTIDKETEKRTAMKHRLFTVHTGMLLFVASSFHPSPPLYRWFCFIFNFVHFVFIHNAILDVVLFGALHSQFSSSNKHCDIYVSAISFFFYSFSAAFLVNVVAVEWHPFRHCRFCFILFLVLSECRHKEATRARVEQTIAITNNDKLCCCIFCTPYFVWIPRTARDEMNRWNCLPPESYLNAIFVFIWK